VFHHGTEFIVLVDNTSLVNGQLRLPVDTVMMIIHNTYMGTTDYGVVS
jgi:hypothetical protein